jgi:hypothetical protein
MSAASSAVGLDSSLSSALGALGITSATPINEIMSMLSYEPIMMVGKCVDESLATGTPGDMLSTMQVTLTELGLKYMWSRFADDVKQTVNKATMANNTLATAISDKTAERIQNKTEIDLAARAKEKVMDVLESMPTGAADCNQQTGRFGLTLSQSNILTDQLNRMLQNGTVQGETTSISLRNKQNASLAKNATDKLLLFNGSGTYDSSNFQAAMAFHDLLFPKQLPLPRNSTASSEPVAYIDHVTNDQTRVFASQGLRSFLLDKVGVIDRKDLDKGFADYIPIPATQKQKTDSKKFADRNGEDVSVDKISRETYWQAIANRYSSPQFLADLDGLNEEGVMKEKTRMDAYINQMFLEIREVTVLQNALEALSAKKVVN